MENGIRTGDHAAYRRMLPVTTAGSYDGAACLRSATSQASVIYSTTIGPALLLQRGGHREPPFREPTPGGTVAPEAHLASCRSASSVRVTVGKMNSQGWTGPPRLHLLLPRGPLSTSSQRSALSPTGRKFRLRRGPEVARVYDRKNRRVPLGARTKKRASI